MIIPLRTDSPLRRTPYMNWALIAANVICYIIQQLNPDRAQDFMLSPRDPRLHCFITYMFLHANPLHIGGNMLFLYIFGNNVNDKMGNLGYLAFYLAGGVFAGIGYVLSGQDPVLGASGAIAAVTGAYLILFPLSHVTVFYFWYFFGQYEVPSFWFILFFFVYDVILNFAGQDNVAHAAHIGGTVFGVAICFAMLAARLLPRDQFDVVALVQRWNRRRQYRDMVSRGFDPFGGVTAGGRNAPPPPPDPRTEQIMRMRAAISDALARHDTAAAAQLYLELKQIDPQQVLSKQAQLDVANTLAGEQLYPQAAEAYELLLRNYPKAERIEQVELMLGLIYARYLAQYQRAKEYLQRAMTRLHGENELALAREELARISAFVPPGA